MAARAEQHCTATCAQHHSKVGFHTHSVRYEHSNYHISTAQELLISACLVLAFFDYVYLVKSPIAGLGLVRPSVSRPSLCGLTMVSNKMQSSVQCLDVREPMPVQEGFSLN